MVYDDYKRGGSDMVEAIQRLAKLTRVKLTVGVEKEHVMLCRSFLIKEDFLKEIMMVCLELKQLLDGRKVY